MNVRIVFIPLLLLPLGLGCAMEADEPHEGPGMSEKATRGGKGGDTPSPGTISPHGGPSDRTTDSPPGGVP